MAGQRPDADQPRLIFLDTGQLDKAIADFTRAHELAPDNPWPLANRGVAHAWKVERAAAESDFAAARALDPTNVIPLHGEAILALHDEDLPSAIAHLSEALRRDPHDLWALRMRGDVYWRAGEHAKAQDDDDRLAELVERLRRKQTHQPA